MDDRSMNDQQVGRLFRLLRVRKGWRQEDASERARISRNVSRKIERGELSTTSLGLLRKYALAFDLRLDLVVGGRGGDLARTIDEEHATIVEQLAAILTRLGWRVEPEASFNHYGDRGRIDLLAYHPATGTLLIIEVKTVLTDLQAMFGSMNVKHRVASVLAKERGWEIRQVGSLLAIASSSASRQVVRRHATLFGSFASEARVVYRWMEAPGAGARMLLWVDPPRPRRAWNAGRMRVRPKAGSRRPAAG